MAIYRMRRSSNEHYYGREEGKKLVRQAERNPAGEVPRRICQSCGNPAYLYEKFHDRSTFKCSECGVVASYTMSPAEMQGEAAPPEKVKRLGAITLRDRSNERKRARKEKSEENLNLEKKPTKKKYACPTISESRAPVAVQEDAEPEHKDPENVEQEDVVEEKPKPVVDIIRSAMGDGNTLTFEYTNKKGIKSSRKVEPYKLSKNNGGYPVLFAYCLDGSGIRVFSLANVINCKPSDNKYEPRWPVEDML